MNDSTLIIAAQDIEFSPFVKSLRDLGADLTIRSGGADEPFMTIASAVIPSREVEGDSAAVSVIVPVKIGRVACALATQWAATNLAPDRIIVVGVAGSLAPDRALLGAMMVASNVIDASEVRYGDSKVDFRHIVYSCSSNLRRDFLQTAEAIGIKAQTTDFLCTDSVIASASVRDNLANHFPTAGCVEMESGGVGAALATGFPSIPWLSIRVIVDLSDTSKRVDAATILDEALCRLSRLVIAAIGF